MKRYTVETVDPYDMEESADGTWCMFEDAKAAIQAAVLVALSDAARRVEAISAGMFNCDMNGSPADEYIAKWKAIQALENP